MPKISENQRAFILTVLFFIGASCLIYGATYFAGILGLTVEEGGIYADCSKRENRSNPYCRPKESDADRSWRNIGGKGQHAPFSLTQSE